MRIVIDMQGAQTAAAKAQGTADYTREMTKALIGACAAEDSVYLALNGAFKKECDELIDTFSDLLPRDNIKVWNWYLHIDPGAQRMEQTIREEELFREWFLAQFDADVIWVPSLQEGENEENIAVSAGLTKGRAALCASVHDVDALLKAGTGNLHEAGSEKWKQKKQKDVQNCDCLLADTPLAAERLKELTGGAVPVESIRWGTEPECAGVLPADGAARKEEETAYTWQEAGKTLYCLFTQMRQKCHEEENYTKAQLLNDLSIVCRMLDTGDKQRIARSVEDSMLTAAKRHIFVDTSSVVIVEFVSGIQRVVNGMVQGLQELLANRSDIEVVPIYSSTHSDSYYRAYYNGKKYVKRAPGTGGAVQFYDGDLFLAADLLPANAIAKQDFFRDLSRRNVKVITTLYDLIPVEFPQFYTKEFADEFNGYLAAILSGDGVVSISKATMNYYKEWCSKQNLTVPHHFLQDYNYIGCDFEKANPSKGLPENWKTVIEKMQETPTFLMVSTIEPRKKQDQVVEAMEILWKKGIQANLVLAGRNGWFMESFVKKLNKHEERGKRLEWLAGISDEYLDLVYQNATAVVVASLQEGYGLSIVEGGKYEKPLILRDIPVFREVAGDNACYFDAQSGKELAPVLEKWLQDYQNGTIQKPGELHTVSWKESARNLLECVGFSY